MISLVAKCLVKKNMSALQKEFINRTFCSMQPKRNVCCLQGKHPNGKLGSSKFCTFQPKWCVFAGSSGTHSVSVCSIHQNAIPLVDATNWHITYKDLISKIGCDSTRKECMMHQCKFCPGRAGLKQFVDEQLSDIDLESEIHYNQ